MEYKGASVEQRSRGSKRTLKQRGVLGQEEASLRQLEELVFGAEERLTQGDLEQENSGFVSDEEDDERQGNTHTQSPRRAVWEDEEDQQEEEIDMKHRFRKDLKKSDAEGKLSKQRLQQRLKEQFEGAMGGAPNWAEGSQCKKMKTDEEEEEEDLLRRTGNFIASSDCLPKGIIKIKKCLNANNERPAEAPLSTVQFHPSAQILMTASLDKSLALFQVDGRSNPLIQSVHLEKFPVHKASFTMDGEQIVSPDGKFLLLSGSFGYMHLMSTKSWEVVQSVKMNGYVCGAAFGSDSSKIFSSSQEGEIYLWDVRSSTCLKKFPDDGCIRATSLALSKDGRYLACGSRSGVVNIYSQNDCVSLSQPKPLKAVMNLVTQATSLCFNSSSEILAIGSRDQDEANRLVHLQSFTVFSNFPQYRNKIIHRTQSLDFSPNCGFYSVANNKGKALLFRILHYNDF
ncbi:hypothetical protein DNTS_005526 [Danionella cerebrum]|uniref:Uncharacterized protein n=1 Tax=Danionella cerebrum TaxID=2873325 RepID=A0A553NJS6_9TELE|nr:hypothetical protein DNTS_005526 [Danionella translucida]